DNSAFSNAFFVADIGPNPITLGSIAALAFAQIVASGVKPSSSAFFRLITKTTAAQSLIPDAFPAVTDPSFLNAGRKLDNFSVVVSGLIYSSVSNITGSPLRFGIEIGTISSLNLPAFFACAAFILLALANSSCSSRVRLYASQIFSAVTPI